MYINQNKSVRFKDLGLMDYQKAWDYQERIFKEVVQGKIANRDLPEDQQNQVPNYLFFVEHPHVFTLGKSGKEENLLISVKELEKKGIQYFKTNRGGDITYHGPGQIVGYPILDLDNFFTDIHLYLRTLEEAVIRTLAELRIRSGRIEGLTGVWLDYDSGEKARKICAIGVRASRWVTMHGFAFNINTPLEYYDYIVPCGIEDKAVTSLADEFGEKQNIDAVKTILRKHLVDLFDMNLI